MKSIYNLLIKPILFFWPPEKAHRLTINLLRFTLALPLISSLFRRYMFDDDKKLLRSFWDIDFKNPVGLAAGFDKDGKYYKAMAALGFGFIEIGTVTPLAQDGNPQPRLFRLKKDRGLINRMGFNNEGVDALVRRLKKDEAFIRESGVIIGGNIGKNKLTPNDLAYQDYEICFEKLFPYVHYFVVNVSSPNTPNLRALQDKAPLMDLLNRLQKINRQKQNPKPILLKIAPDLTDGQLDDIISIVKETKIEGVIATNTTIDRSNLKTASSEIESIGNGGLSGAPVKSRSTEVIKYLYDKAHKDIFIIGVGGIESPEDALEKLEAGAQLVQVYSGMIYYGPTLVKDILKRI